MKGKGFKLKYNFGCILFIINNWLFVFNFPFKWDFSGVFPQLILIAVILIQRQQIALLFNGMSFIKRKAFELWFKDAKIFFLLFNQRHERKENINRNGSIFFFYILLFSISFFMPSTLKIYLLCWMYLCVLSWDCICYTRRKIKRSKPCFYLEKKARWYNDGVAWWGWLMFLSFFVVRLLVPITHYIFLFSTFFLLIPPSNIHKKKKTLTCLPFSTT